MGTYMSREELDLFSEDLSLNLSKIKKDRYHFKIIKYIQILIVCYLVFILLFIFSYVLTSLLPN